MFMYYYAVCYFTCIFYAVVRQISLLFIDNKDTVFCIILYIYIHLPDSITKWVFSSNTPSRSRVSVATSISHPSDPEVTGDRVTTGPPCPPSIASRWEASCRRRGKGREEEWARRREE